MDYEWCRIDQLVRHAANGDTQAQSLLVEEIRGYLRALATLHSAERQTVPDFSSQLIARVRSVLEEHWSGELEFSRWMDAVLQRVAAAVCESL